MENITSPVPVHEDVTAEARRLTVGQRLGNLVSASAEFGIALWALSGEVNPNTPLECVRDIACSALAYLAVRGAVEETYASATGTGKPSIMIIFPKKQENAAEQTDS